METYKILHLIDSAGVYGAEKIVLNLLEELDNTAFSEILGCIRENELQKPQIAIEAEAKGIKVEYFTMKRGFNLNGIKQITKYIYNNNISLVHSHGYKSNIYLGILPKRRFKIVSTVHGWSKKSGGIKAKLYELLDSWSLKRVDMVVAVSKGVIRDLEGRGINKNRIRLIYNGINIENNISTFDKNSLRKQYGLCSNDYIIGAVGRLTKVKGHSYLIEAMPSILKEIRNCKIIIAGEGPLREYLTSLIKKKNLNKHVELIGYTEHIEQILDMIDLFVLPSLSEGLPISLLEAMVHGKPVLASAVGGVSEVISNGNGGILIPPADPEAIATAVKRLYRDQDQMIKSGIVGRKLVENNFSSKSMANQYLNIYSNLTS